jgi:hypothetical protein
LSPKANFRALQVASALNVEQAKAERWSPDFLCLLPLTRLQYHINDDLQAVRVSLVDHRFESYLSN